MVNSSTDDALTSSTGRRHRPKLRPQATAATAREELVALAAAYEDAHLMDPAEVAPIPASACLNLSFQVQQSMVI